MPALLALPILLLTSVLLAQEYPFTEFTPDYGTSPLPSASVQKMLQDRQGYMWFAFYSSGLARYDGHSMTTYSTADGLRDLTGREMVQDANGRLWVGTESGLVCSDRPLQAYGPNERVHFVGHAGGQVLPESRMRGNSIVADGSGRVFAGLPDNRVAVFHFEGSRLQRYDIPLSATGVESVSALLHRQNGSLWIATTSGGLFISSDGRSAVAAPSLPAGRGMISAMSEIDGEVWVGRADGGVYRWSDREQVFTPVSLLLHARIYAIEQEGPFVWIASVGAGVLRIDRQTGASEVLSRRNGFLSESVWDILRDVEGNLWFAQNGGVSRLPSDYRAFRRITGRSHFGEPPLLPDISAFTVLPPSNGQPFLWVGTGGGLAAFLPDLSVSRSFKREEGLTSNSIYSLTVDSRSRVWVGTAEGVNCFSQEFDVPQHSTSRTAVQMPGGRSLVLSTFDISDTPVYSIAELRLNRSDPTRQSIWFAGSFGLAALIGDRQVFFRGAAGLPRAGATSLTMDGRGYLWIATADGGLFRSKAPMSEQILTSLAVSPAGEVTAPVFAQVWSRANGAQTNSMRKVFWDGTHLWVGTAAGLVAADVAPFRILASFGSRNGLGGDSIIGISRSPVTGHLWVSQTGGLAEVDPKAFRVIRTVTRQQGLIDDEAWAYDSVASDSEGLIYFATPKGVALLRPDLIDHDMVPPVVRLRSIAFQQNDAGENELEAEYAALSYRNEGLVRYRTRIVGYDSAWSEPKHDVTIRYTNLGAFLVPKTYTLEVVAQNADGVWSSEPLRYPFVVKPAWWFRWWAFALYIVALAGLAYSFNRWRTFRLKKQNLALEKLVGERTAEIRSQARELETVDRIVQVINREVSLDRLLNALLEQGLVLFPQAEKGVFLVFDEQRGNCHIAASSGYDPRSVEGVSFSIEEAVRRYCEGAELLDEGVYLVRDFKDIAGADKVSHVPTPKSMLAMEVALGGMLEGFLVFDNFHDRDAFDRSDLRKLSRYREHAINAISKARTLRELELKNREAQLANQAKSAFLANMSHELRTPMNAIIGFSEILIERLEQQITERHFNFLKLIHSSGEHLLAIINDILDLSKIEAGRMEVFPERFELAPVVEGVTHLMKAMADKQGVEIRIDVAPEVTKIRTDPGKFKQVLYNLLSNAVKFSHSGSTVEVIVRHLPAALEGNDAISVSVIDHGIGIAPEHLQAVFEEFRQIDGGVTRQFGGTGLGLALVKKFVELQHGRVLADSTPGKGSAFTFILPVESVVKPEEQKPGDLPSGERVLIIEDDPVTYEKLRGYVDSAGYIPVRAKNGDEALRLSKEIRPAVITLDLVLPGLDGWEVLKKLKMDPQTKDVPVVIVSMTENRELGLALGAEDYFVKPVDRERLVARLRQITASKKPARLLLIDDDPAIHELLASELGASGYSVASKLNGADGLLAASGESPDVVILDLMMPGMNGFEVAERLKGNVLTSRIPIIALTAKELTDEDRARLNLHISAVVQKGAATRSRLIDAIRQIEGRRQAQPAE